MVERKVYSTTLGWQAVDGRRRFNEATTTWDTLNNRVVFGRNGGTGSSGGSGGGTVTPPVDEAARREQLTAWAITGDPRGYVLENSDWIGPTDRSKLVAAPNAGGTWTISTPGVYENLDIRAVVRVTTTGAVKIRNFIHRGYNKTWTSQSAWIVNASGGVMNLTLEDGEINPDYATPWANGYSGPDTLMRRVRVLNCNDSIGQFTRNGDNRFRAEACYFDKLTFFTPDAANPSTTWPKGRPNTHNDNCQIFQGSGVKLLGCNMNCMVALDRGTPPYGIGIDISSGAGAGHNRSYPAANGQCVAMTPSLSAPITNNTVKYCRLDGGEAGISVVKLGTQTAAGHDLSFNRFGSRMGTVNSGRPVPIQIEQGLIVPGFDTTTLGWKNDTRGNVWEATGDPIQYLVRTF